MLLLLVATLFTSIAAERWDEAFEITESFVFIDRFAFVQTDDNGEGLFVGLRLFVRSCWLVRSLACLLLSFVCRDVSSHCVRSRVAAVPSRKF